jgi:hypothetical protein
MQPKHSQSQKYDIDATRIRVLGGYKMRGTDVTTGTFSVVGDANIQGGLWLTEGITASTLFVNNINTTGFSLIDGNEADGRVLTSDANGLGTWKSKLWDTNDTPELVNGPSDNKVHIDYDVGIGTTDPVEKLEISTTGALGAQINNVALGNCSSNLDHGILTHTALKAEANSYGLRLLDSGETYVNSKSEIQLQINNTRAVTVDSSGFVGIGVTPTESLHVGSNAIIEGDLTVNGTLTSINSSTIEIEDANIHLAKNNPADIVDIGFFGEYIDGSVTKFTGLFRDTSEADKKYILFDNSEIAPTTTFTGITQLADLKLNGLDVSSGITFATNSELRHDGLTFIGTNPEIFFTNDGKIGMGVTTPTETLEIDGTQKITGNVIIGSGITSGTYPDMNLAIDGTGGILLPNGNTSQRPGDIVGAIRYNTELDLFEGYDAGSGWIALGGIKVIDNDADTFIEAEQFQDEDALRFVTDGTQGMVLDKRQNLAIGITFGISEFAENRLEVYSTDAILIPVGNTAERPSTKTGLIRYNSTRNTFEGYINSRWRSMTGVMDGDGDTYIEEEETADEDRLKFYTNGLIAMTMDNNQNIGIGTTNPTVSLEVNDTDAIGLPQGNTAERPSGVSGHIRYNSDRDAIEGFTGQGWRSMTRLIDADQLVFYTAGNLSMVVDSNQRVGIGVTDPSSALEVNGTITTDGLIVNNDALINGNLTISGSVVTVGTTTLSVNDPLIILAANNTGDIVDTGFYSKYVDTGVSKYTGLYRDTTDKIYKLFHELEVEPTTTVDIGATGFQLTELQVSVLDTDNIDYSNLLSFRNTSNTTNVVVTQGGFVGIGTTALYPLHVSKTNSSNWSARFTNNAADVFLASDNGNGASINSGASNSNTSYALKVRNADTDNVFVVTNDEEVGILTNAPANVFDISTTGLGRGGKFGSAFAGNYINDITIASFSHHDVSGTINQFAVNQTSGGETTLNSAAGNSLKLSIANDEKLTVTNVGNVGIGITNPTNLFEVNGGNSTMTASSGFALSLFNTLTTVDLANANGSGILVSSATTSNYGVSIRESGNALFQVNNDGNVGIGTTTPVELLEVSTGITSSGIKSGSSFIGNWATDSTVATFSHHDLSTNGTGYAIRQTSTGETFINSASGQDINFSTGDSQNAVISGVSGYFGIGTTIPPEFQLDVNGDTRLGGNVTITGDLTFQGIAVSLTDSLLKLADGNTSNTFDIGFFGQYNDGGGNKYSGVFRDATDNKIKIFVDSEVEPSGNTVDIGATGYTEATLVVGSLESSGVVQGSTFLSTCDKRVKENIVKKTQKGYLDKFSEIDLYEYNYIKEYSNNNQKMTGLIAQEVEKVIPEAIHKSTLRQNENTYDDFRRIDQTALLANLIGAVKELNTNVIRQNERILSLESKLFKIDLQK